MKCCNFYGLKRGCVVKGKIGEFAFGFTVVGDYINTIKTSFDFNLNID